jgi:glycosyltransferase involved in cell wall biosynthesis
MQFYPSLSTANIELITSPLFDDRMLFRKYQWGNYGFQNLLFAYFRRLRILWKGDQYDLVWIEKEALPWMPARFEAWLLRNIPYVLDFDDAIFHNYDSHSIPLVRHIYKQRIDYLMQRAKLVIAGNKYLANRAKCAGALWVEIVPTVVDLDRYHCKKTDMVNSMPKIVWIGSPSTAIYLSDLAGPLAELAKQFPFELRVIGGGRILMSGVKVESIDWSLDSEGESISECVIGIMPLRDSPWEQGKCAYKLIQYMACGLPTVASPIGANNDVSISNQTGLFAGSKDEWVKALLVLLSDEMLRQKLGQAGRMMVEKLYSLQITAPRLANLLIQAGSR